MTASVVPVTSIRNASRFQAAGSRGANAIDPSSSRRPANPYTSDTHEPAIAATWTPWATLPLTSSRSMRAVCMK